MNYCWDFFSTDGRNSPPQPPEPSSSTAPVYNQDPLQFSVEDFHSGVGSQSKQASIEKQMPNLDNVEFPINEAYLIFTPGNSGDNERSIPSSASGNGFLPREPGIQLPSGRSNIKRPSSSRQSGSSLAPVAEEDPWELNEPQFKLRRLSEHGPPHDQEMLVETGPSQTPHPHIDHPIDRITDAI